MRRVASARDACLDDFASGDDFEARPARPCKERREQRIEVAKLAPPEMDRRREFLSLDAQPRCLNGRHEVRIGLRKSCRCRPERSSIGVGAFKTVGAGDDHAQAAEASPYVFDVAATQDRDHERRSGSAAIEQPPRAFVNHCVFRALDDRRAVSVLRRSLRLPAHRWKR